MMKSEPPTEVMKRAVSAATRAIGRQRELDVTFGPETPGLQGERVRLPSPGRDMDSGDVARLRGIADSFALRLRHHDDGLHRKLVPSAGAGRVVFEAIEQSRVEALGARAMQGVAGNLQAALEERCRARGYDRVTDREQAPIAEVLGLMLRERLASRFRRAIDRWTWRTLTGQTASAIQQRPNTTTAGLFVHSASGT